MAMNYSCDGCGCSVEKPKVVGFVLKRDYCPACEVIAQAFITAEETERSVIASVFQEKRNKLIEHFGQNGFKLPDVPHAG